MQYACLAKFIKSWESFSKSLPKQDPILAERYGQAWQVLPTFDFFFENIANCYVFFRLERCKFVQIAQNFKMFPDGYLLAKIDFDKAENEPPEVPMRRPTLTALSTQCAGKVNFLRAVQPRKVRHDARPCLLEPAQPRVCPSSFGMRLYALVNRHGFSVYITETGDINHRFRWL